jgi:beta-alanine--pyruvate transaminase
VLIRFTGDILAFSPPLIISEEQIQHIFKTVRDVLATVQ